MALCLGVAVTRERLTIAHRVWTSVVRKQSKVKTGRTNGPFRAKSTQETHRTNRGPTHVLFFDTETTTDETQALLFGAWEYCRITEGGLELIAHGLLYADELPDVDPEGMAVLEAYANGQAGPIPFELLSRADFVESLLFQAAYRTRARVVGFNLPFDLSRLALGWTAGRGRFRGGFSFYFWAGDVSRNFKERRQRPRIAVKPLDTKGAFIEFKKALSTEKYDLIPEGDDSGRPDPTYAWRGRFVDVATLAFALTGKTYSLKSACVAFGVAGKARVEGHGRITPEYVDYCREDVAATRRLYLALMAELDLYDVDLPPERAFSPASLSKAHLERWGMRPLRAQHPRFPDRAHGQAMAAFFGGRAECRIRRSPVPVVLTDVTSMYPTVNALMDLQRFRVARQLVARRSTSRVRDLLENVNLEKYLDPEYWGSLVGFARVRPDGDILPVRGQLNGSTFTIAVTEVTSDEGLWYAIPDLAASVLLTGRTPEILEAWTLEAVGQDFRLRSSLFRGRVYVDPAVADPIVALVEERQWVKKNENIDHEERERIAAAIKLVVNAGSYGVYSEFNVEERRRGELQALTVFGRDDPFIDHVSSPENPGRYCFPPLASCITAGARLMLAIMERLATDAGGCWTFCDTDSMAIVATEDGGFVPCPGGPHRLPDGREAVHALSFAEVDAIRETLNALNPYDREAIPDILKVEARAQCFAISAKRYALFHVDEAGDVTFVDDHPPSESGLGHFMSPVTPGEDPKAWITEAWAWIIKRALGIPVKTPEWFDRPTIARHSVSTPKVLEAFNALNEGRPYREQVKPFNFIVTALGARPPADRDSVSSFRLIAPYTRDAREWEDLEWTDVHDPVAGPCRITTREARPGLARVPTFGEMLERYETQPEAKSLGPDGLVCGRMTEGLLSRRPVVVGEIKLIGKESNRIAQRATGELDGDDADETTAFYDDGDYWRRIAMPELTRRGAGWVARIAHMSDRRARDIVLGHSQPHPTARSRILKELQRVGCDRGGGMNYQRRT